MGSLKISWSLSLNFSRFVLTLILHFTNHHIGNESNYVKREVNVWISKRYCLSWIGCNELKDIIAFRISLQENVHESKYIRCGNIT